MIIRYQYLRTLLMLIAACALLQGCSSNDSSNNSQGPAYLGTDYFVSASSGLDTNSGKLGAPFASIQRAIDTAALTGGRVFVAEGTYNESIVLAKGVKIFGGYKDSTFRKGAGAVTTIRGAAHAVFVNADSVTIDGFTINSADAAAPGMSSIGISVADAVGVTITNNVIRTGKGSNGRNRIKPATPAKSPDGAPGFAATANGCDFDHCASGEGGSGGKIAKWSGGDGGWACTSGACPDGTDGMGPDHGGGGTTKALFGGRGTDGGNGGPGAKAGANGSGGAAFGTMILEAYVPASGADGGEGDHGNGGGGGGGGGAGLFKGGSGGGGGAGAQGGDPGPGGEGGGASIAILISGNSKVTIENNSITTSNGGAGGAGAPGGDPGLPGAGAAGGAASILYGSAGGNGGNGGAGKVGGHGGGGGGGPSIGIAEASTSSMTGSDNTFTLGSGGLGGASSGNKGADGQVADYWKL
jgi:hypothetical protein